MDWGDFLNNQAQDLIGSAVSRAQPAPAPPIQMAPSGIGYVEGKPAAGAIMKPVQGGLPVIFGLKPVIYLSLAAALAVGGYFAFRK